MAHQVGDSQENDVALNDRGNAALPGVLWLSAQVDGAKGPLPAGRPLSADEVAEGLLWPSEPDASYVTLAQVRQHLEGITWAWPGWIPSGYLTLLMGPRGAGKSYLAAYLLGALGGHVRQWPDSTPVEGSRRPVLLVDTEGGRGQYAERLSDMGIPEAQVFLPGQEPTHVPRFPGDTHRVAALAKLHGCAGVVMDSLDSGPFQDGGRSDTRSVLLALARMALVLRIPVLLVYHTETKRLPFTMATTEGVGQVGRFCASAMGFCPAGEAGGPVGVVSLANALGPNPQPFGFVAGQGGPIFCPWNSPDEPISALEKAMSFLQRELAGKPRRGAELVALAEAQGMSRSTLYRARRRLGIQRGAWWALPPKG